VIRLISLINPILLGLEEDKTKTLAEPIEVYGTAASTMVEYSRGGY
jgi:hypothetical protein